MQDIRKAFVNTFTGGMNTDIDVSLLQNNQYRYAENLSLNGNTDSTDSVLSTLDSSKPLEGYHDVGGEGWKCLKSITVDLANMPADWDEVFRQSIVLFLFNDDVALNGETESKVWGKLILLPVVEGEIKTSPSKTIFQSSELNWHEGMEIDVTFKDDTLYWADGVNPMRSLRIIRDYNTNPGGAPEYRIIDIENTPEYLKEPSIVSIETGGTLQVGLYQWCYRYYRHLGDRSQTSLASETIGIYKYPYQYTGEGSVTGIGDTSIWSIDSGAAGDTTDKKVVVSIQKSEKYIPSNEDDYIKIYRIYYKDPTQTPIITVVADSKCSDLNIGGDFYNFTDTGSTTNVSENDLSNVLDSVYFKSVRTLEQKNGSLYAGGVAYNAQENEDVLSGITLNVDLYKYNGGSGAWVFNGTNDENIAHCDEYTGFNTENYIWTAPYNIEVNASYLNMRYMYKNAYYQSGEKYRFGLMLFNKSSGWTSVVKTVDVTYPEEDLDHRFVRFYSTYDAQNERSCSKMYRTFPTITLTHPSGDAAKVLLDNGYTHWKIVRIYRKDEHRRTVATGVAQHLVHKSDGENDDYRLVDTPGYLTSNPNSELLYFQNLFTGTYWVEESAPERRHYLNRGSSQGVVALYTTEAFTQDSTVLDAYSLDLQVLTGLTAGDYAGNNYKHITRGLIVPTTTTSSVMGDLGRTASQKCIGQQATGTILTNAVTNSVYDVIKTHTNRDLKPYTLKIDTHKTLRSMWDTVGVSTMNAGRDSRLDPSATYTALKGVQIPVSTIASLASPIWLQGRIGNIGDKNNTFAPGLATSLLSGSCVVCKLQGYSVNHEIGDPATAYGSPLFWGYRVTTKSSNPSREYGNGAWPAGLDFLGPGIAPLCRLIKNPTDYVDTDVYVSCGDSIAISDGISKVAKYGDTFYYTAGLYVSTACGARINPDGGWGGSGRGWGMYLQGMSYVVFPTESKYNLYLTPKNNVLSLPWLKGNATSQTLLPDNYSVSWLAVDGNGGGLCLTQEYAGASVFFNTTGITVSDMFYSSKYNSLSSEFQNFFQTNEKANIGDNTKNNRVHVSSDTATGSYDPYTDFKVNDFTDLLGTSGTLTKLKLLGAQLFFIQSKGVGTIRAAEKSLIQTEGVGALTLGTGNRLGGYDYLSTTIGTDKQKKITSTQHDIYFIKTDTLELYSLKSLSNLTRTKGVLSLTNRYDEGYDNCSLGYDMLRRDIHMKINADKKATLIFDEDLQVFTSLYRYAPEMFINTTNRFYYSVLDQIYSIYEDQSSQNNLDGEQKQSILNVIHNTEFNSTKVFDSIQAMMYHENLFVRELRATYDQREKEDLIFFTTGTFGTAQQVSDTINFTMYDENTDEGNVRLLNGLYSFQLPRDSQTEGRLVDKFLDMYFTYTPTKRLVIQNIRTNSRLAFR